MGSARCRARNDNDWPEIEQKIYVAAVNVKLFEADWTRLDAFRDGRYDFTLYNSVGRLSPCVNMRFIFVWLISPGHWKHIFVWQAAKRMCQNLSSLLAVDSTEHTM